MKALRYIFFFCAVLMIIDFRQTLAEGQPQRLAEGATRNLRIGNDGDLIISSLHGKFYEQAFRRNIFFLDSDAIAITTAYATKGTLGTVTSLNGFYNPRRSGVNAVLANMAAYYLLGSGGMGGNVGLYYNILLDVPISSAASGTIRSGFLSATASSRMRPLVNVVISQTGGTNVPLIQLATAGVIRAPFSGNTGIASLSDPIEGKIIVPPGALFTLQTESIGTPLNNCNSTLAWEEVAC